MCCTLRGMKRLSSAAALILLASVTAAAHHSFGAECTMTRSQSQSLVS